MDRIVETNRQHQTVRERERYTSKHVRLCKAIAENKLATTKDIVVTPTKTKSNGKNNKR